MIKSYIDSIELLKKEMGNTKVSLNQKILQEFYKLIEVNTQDNDLETAYKESNEDLRLLSEHIKENIFFRIGYKLLSVEKILSKFINIVVCK